MVGNERIRLGELSAITPASVGAGQVAAYPAHQPLAACDRLGPGVVLHGVRANDPNLSKAYHTLDFVSTPYIIRIRAKHD